MISLPEQYLKNMQKLLGNEFPEFLLSYEEPARKGLRFNIAKVRKETVDFLIGEWNLKPVSWCSTGYYFDCVRPGLSPYHDSGIFYIQEPSAMSVAETVEIGPEESVLDLCAAPGGKSTAAAERCKFLVSNEIHPQRARILSSNIERLGFSNVIVTQSSPSQLADVFPEQFDTVLCDAPCSGEGMMRKDETAVSEWSPENVLRCIERQKEILDSAAILTAPGGKLVYSTCTFEYGENEGQIENFLKTHSDFTVQKMHRIWPHRENGEGHFCAVLRKNSPVQLHSAHDHSCEKLLQSMTKRMNASKLHILRAGLSEGEYFTDRKGIKIYEPSHAEIMHSSFQSYPCGVSLRDPAEAGEYLKGNVLRLNDSVIVKGENGYCGVYFDGYPLGLGKRVGDVVKNHLPKGLRKF